MSIKDNLENINLKISSEVCLVAVSKTKPISDILEAYDCGQRVFGENKIQELVEKHKKLPKDIEWHMIGHIQRNKVKYMAPFISLIHSADSYRLIKEINKQGKINNRVINCLLQIKIASEESKFGFTETEATDFLNSDEYVSFKNIKIIGLMGMATFTEDQKKNGSNEMDNTENAIINVKTKLVELKELKESISLQDSDEKNDNQNIEVKSESFTRNNFSIWIDFKCG